MTSDLEVLACSAVAAVVAVFLIHVKKGKLFYEMKPFIASNTLEMLRMNFIFPWLQKEL